jgi:HAE1 family hydrophobic/amphiphilic exporter-1
MEKALLAIPDVYSVFTSVSVAGAGFQAGSGGRATLSVQLVPKHERHESSLDIIQKARQIGRRIPGATVSARPNSSLPGGASTGRLDINVSGPDLETLVQVVDQVKTALGEIPGFIDIEDSGTEGTPELQIVLDGTRMAQLNVTSQQAIDALRTTLGGRVVSVLRPTGKPQQDITVVASDVDRTNLTQLAAIPVRGGSTLNPNSNVQSMVTLGQVATIGYGTGPVEIQRTDRNRTIEIGGTVVGRSLGDVATEMQTTLAALDVPPGYTVRTGRQVSRFNEALVALAQALALALILEYMLLVALYHSWVYPLVLLLSVPLGLVGSIFGLYLTGNTINVFSLMGMIMAFGLVAKNGILLIDYTNALRERGLSRTDALVESARTRLRPILMTSAVMVFGMFPLALKLEEGAESRAPMAVVVIGAILTSTVLAIAVIPAVYTLLDDLQALLARRPVRLAQPTHAAASQPIAAVADNGAYAGAYAVATHTNGQGNGVGASVGHGAHNGNGHANGAIIPAPGTTQRPIPSRQS